MADGTNGRNEKMRFELNNNKEYDVADINDLISIVSNEYSVQPFQILISNNKQLDKTFINLRSKLGEVFACVGEILEN